MPLPFPHRRGFTLIELMVVVVVIGILAAVAYPAYTSHVQRSRRADAVNVLSAIVQAQERYRANHTAYGATPADVGVTTSSISSHYEVTINEIGSPPSLVTGYRAIAKALRGSSQSNDTKCAEIGVELDGATFSYIATDSAGNDTRTYCWPR